MKRRWGRSAGLAAWALLLLLTAGCLYPKDQTPGNEVSAREAVLTVQDAVDRYREKTGLLPIQNADATVPVYEKYKLDFAKLKRMGYISHVPNLAFENGGHYVFLVIDEETKPQVKLLDLTVFQALNDLQREVDAYGRAHGGALPAGKEAAPGFSYLDFDRLGAASPKLNSMYSGRPLDVLIDEAGNVRADYAVDIATALQKQETPPTSDEDLRGRLAAASYFVPVKSPVYRWVGDGPQPMLADQEF